jgi:hypothetical protein
MILESVCEELRDDFSAFDRPCMIWNGREVTKMSFETSHIQHLVTISRMNPSETSLSTRSIKPMKGNASVEISKDSEGETTTTVEVTHTSDNGKVSFTAEGSINSSGEVSGSAKVGVNWDRD